MEEKMAIENKTPTQKDDINDDPMLRPVYRIGKSLLTFPALLFILPSLVITFCVYLKTAGRVLLSILMGGIGFFWGVLLVNTFMESPSLVHSYMDETIDGTFVQTLVENSNFKKEETLFVIILLSVAIVLTLLLGIICWIFGWKKAVPLLEMNIIDASKRITLKILIMFGIFILVLIALLELTSILSRAEDVTVFGIASIVPVIYWLITLIRPKKKI
jgi:hypothetical protein